MRTTPLVVHASAAHARAVRFRDPGEIESARADLEEAKALNAIGKAGLTPEQRERVAVALLTDTVAAWLQRTLAAAPKELDPATRAKVARLLSGGEGR